MNDEQSPSSTQRGWVELLGVRYAISALALLLAGGIAASGAAAGGGSHHSSKGFSVLYLATGKPTRSELSATASDLTDRLRALGLDGSAAVRRRNEIALSVRTVPRQDRPAQIAREIGQSGQVYFRPVLCYAPPYAKPAANGTTPTTAPSQTLPTTCTSRYALVTSNLAGGPTSGTGVLYKMGATPDLAPFKSTSGTTTNYKNETVLLPGLSSGERYLLGPTVLTGHAVKGAVARTTTLGRWVVNVSLTGSGTTGWNAMAKEYFHDVIGIELDGVVQSAPLTLPNTSAFKAFNGSVQISGTFSRQQAQTLALALDTGALPVHLEDLSVRPG